MPIKEGLDAIIDGSSRVLILGSLPSDRSLEVREYYASPRNHFWRILSCIYDEPIGTDYELKRAFLHRRGIALWDVLKVAERKGSLDSNIRRPAVNDLERVIQKHPRISTVGMNGTKAWGLFSQHWCRHPVFRAGRLHVRCLPSSSPVPGKNVKSFEEKAEAWRKFLVLSG
ncbi:MAG: DNA-deoxyinosine glycosylase [Gammaproteobacteria bacterium]|nr:DNA-deoxyinosine glycosylase [Gammaproteobacteria bacterium]